MQEILGNVSTIIAFNVSSADATKLSKEFVVEMGAEVEQVPSEELLRLKVGEALGKIGKTVIPFKTWLADQSPDPIRAKEVIERSRMNYGRSAIDVRSNGTSRIRVKPAQNGTTPGRPVQVIPDDDSDPSQVF